jgi:hypothetical protein
VQNTKIGGNVSIWIGQVNAKNGTGGNKVIKEREEEIRQQMAILDFT